MGRSTDPQTSPSPRPKRRQIQLYCVKGFSPDHRIVLVGVYQNPSANFQAENL